MKTEHVATFHHKMLDSSFDFNLLHQTWNLGGVEHELWILDDSEPYDDVRTQWIYCPLISEIHETIEKMISK